MHGKEGFASVAGRSIQTLGREMSERIDQHAFPYLKAAVEAIQSHANSPEIRARAAASGMIAAAQAALCDTEHFEDTRAVLDALSVAKSALDVAAWHTPEVTGVTSEILSQAQAFFDRETIPCTEWPTPTAVAQAAAVAASAIVTA